MANKLSTPLHITLYDANDEVIAEHDRNHVRWGILKAAMRLAQNFNSENPSEAEVDALAGLVVDAFGNQFSISDLENADIDEMLAILNQIVAKAGSLMRSNPTTRES